MEADWAAEVGADLPVIDADWTGLVDLRRDPAQVDSVLEVRGYAALRAALLRLNAPESPVRTTKCDVWTLDSGDIDPLEFGCGLAANLVGLASYIDLVACDAAVFASFEQHETWAVAAVRQMRQAQIGPGRVDLVIRGAHRAGGGGFGLTLYVAGCGADAVAAQAAWGEALQAACAITMREAAIPGASSSIG
jgi:hypothetical protein